MLNYRANGKLLLTSEYAITQGATGLAIPTRYGQTLNYTPNPDGNCIKWVAKRQDREPWFWVDFSQTLEILATSDQVVAQRLFDMLKVMKNKTALLDRAGTFTTNLEFPQEWGLGTSSTLASLLAQCAGADSLSAFRQVHGGSGYDLACAQADGPILYTLHQGTSTVERTEINFEFKHDIGFVYSGKKQNTQDSLELVKQKPFSDTQIDRFNQLTSSFLSSKTVLELEEVILEHESLISEHLGISKVKDGRFEAYPGKVKSLGGWGGDFVMVTRLAASKKWLRKNGLKVIFPFKSLAL